MARIEGLGESAARSPVQPEKPKPRRKAWAGAWSAKGAPAKGHERSNRQVEEG
jgi:hypothetical protein